MDHRPVFPGEIDRVPDGSSGSPSSGTCRGRVPQHRMRGYRGRGTKGEQLCSCVLCFGIDTTKPESPRVRAGYRHPEKLPSSRSEPGVDHESRARRPCGNGGQLRDALKNARLLKASHHGAHTSSQRFQ